LKKGKRAARNSFFNSTSSVLKMCSDDKDCIEQINTNFKKWILQSPNLTSDYNASVELLEEMVYNFDENYDDEESVISSINANARNRIVKIISIMKETNPFISLSDKEAYALMNLKTAIEDSNKELGNTMLNQVSKDIENLESNLKYQINKSKNSDMTATIGVVLTLVFGLISLLQFIGQ
jgi:uncharacterized protein YsxB (DUF464 family)